MVTRSVVLIAVVAFAAGAGLGAAAPSVRYGEPAAVNAMRVTAPEALKRVPAGRLGDLAATLARIAAGPQGADTDAALTAATRAALGVDDATARQLVLAAWVQAFPAAAAPYGLPTPPGPLTAP